MVAPTDLVGKWRLARTIDDRLAGERLTVDGETVLSHETDGRVRWYESGTMHHGTDDLPVFRTLFVEPRGDEWFVTFEDGRDFHPWSPGAEVVHPCGADTYTGHVEVLSPDRWTVTWRSEGPAKDYTMISTLTR